MVKQLSDAILASGETIIRLMWHSFDEAHTWQSYRFLWFSNVPLEEFRSSNTIVVFVSEMKEKKNSIVVMNKRISASLHSFSSLNWLFSIIRVNITWWQFRFIIPPRLHFLRPYNVRIHPGQTCTPEQKMHLIVIEISQGWTLSYTYWRKSSTEEELPRQLFNKRFSSYTSRRLNRRQEKLF